MNKWQIICPLVAIGLAASVFAIVHGRTEHRGFVLSISRQIGHELIARTNSVHLISSGSDLRARIGDFFLQPVQVDAVLLGDEPSPIGNGRASTRLILKNAKQERLGIRLRQDSDPEKFQILGFWTLKD